MLQSLSTDWWLLGPWDSPIKFTGKGSHSILQQIFPIQGLNLGLPHGRQILYHLSHQGSPYIGGGDKEMMQDSIK